ncbi:Abi family protein [Vibrio sp. B1Z05]|uniref:Abi family protein n=1 Tax=Vibrio sp. B1Z05 TaxID=2654980 RepID=UPI00128DF403|nr:Abi family protein [Vibrio sp. B1Z05]MPW37327.1 Abi family protein [Vibrio sp. B1Z05]
MALIPSKEFKHYEELVETLLKRGMSIDDQSRAKRKLAQVGYYRLSGFWYPARAIERDVKGIAIECPHLKRPKRLDEFLPNTHFDDVFNLYLLDKKLRIAMLDGLERIEVFVRSVIAHELGRGKRKEAGTGEDIPDPLAWTDSDYINGKFLKRRRGQKVSSWDEWQDKHRKLIARSHEDCIIWHRSNHKEMPFWVVIEAWDFGTMSKYYGMLKDKYRQRICARLGITDKTETAVLQAWLMGMNILRNRCAHHTRIWNQQSSKQLPLPSDETFDDIRDNHNTLTRLYGVIRAMWFLIEQIGPSSCWMKEVDALIATLPAVPGCHSSSIGLPS